MKFVVTTIINTHYGFCRNIEGEGFLGNTWSHSLRLLKEEETQYGGDCKWESSKTRKFNNDKKFVRKWVEENINSQGPWQEESKLAANQGISFD